MGEFMIDFNNMNIQENITKFTNLETNDSLSAFQGHTAQQYHGAFEVFYNFIKDVKPKRILEIGTSLKITFNKMVLQSYCVMVDGKLENLM
jgi:Ni,Fe-hydrogenase I small subunit